MRGVVVLKQSRGKMIYFLLFNVLLTGTFVQKWYIDCGTHKGYGRINAADTDHDTRVELIFGSLGASVQERVVIYELDDGDTFALQAVVDTLTISSWATGDLDNDGFFDIMLGGEFNLPLIGPQIYESPDSFSYPTQEVWRDTIGQAIVQPISIFDIDQDGIPEFITNNGDPPNWLWIYESTGNNQYDTVFTSNPDTGNFDGPVSTHAFGDFDLDGRIEFAVGGMSAGALGATYWVYESSANNKYKRILQSYLPTKNIKDCFSVDDADGDGRPEFVLKGYTFNGEIPVFIFEADGNDSYIIVDILYFSGFGNGYYGGYSDAGDVDGDGLPEIALEGSFRVYMIEADGNDNFYVFDTLPGHAGGSTIEIFDIDGNGLDEVIISGSNETRIYEFIPPAVEEEKEIIPATPQIIITPNPFTEAIKITLVGAKKDTKSHLHIYDASGRLVKSVEMETNTYQLGADLVPGVYFLKLNDKPVGKVVKVR